MNALKKIFTGVIRLNPTYHGWPTVIRLKDEELLAVCSGNRVSHVCPFGRVFLYRSTDGGATWSGPEKLSDGPLDDRDAGICRAADGSLLLNYFTNIAAISCSKKNPPEWGELGKNITIDMLKREHGFWMRRSTDEGRTWSEKYPIPLNNPHGPTLLDDGTLFFAGRSLSLSVGWETEGNRLGNELVAARSCDHGLTWEIISNLPVPPGHTPLKCFEPYSIQAPDGRIITQIRDQNLYPSLIQTWQTESSDGGLSWSPPHVVTDGYPTHLLHIRRNRLLMSYGCRDKPFGIRAKVSADSGQNWGGEIVISSDGENADLGYPASAEMPDGTFFTLWYENTDGIASLKYCRWQLIE